jgi:hypothetical protein
MMTRERRNTGRGNGHPSSPCHRSRFFWRSVGYGNGYGKTPELCTMVGMTATNPRQVRGGLAPLFFRIAPFVVVGMMALALDLSFYVASGGMWSFLSLVFFPLWAAAFCACIAGLYALLAMAPPVVLSLFSIAASALRRLAFGNRRGSRPASFPGFLAS